MARVLVTDTYLEDIGDAIRDKLEVETQYKPSEMATAIESIEGYPEPTGIKSITANGTGIDVKDYATADVNVPNSYAVGDEGKVVSNGALVAQSSATKTENGTYDTTLNNEIVVDVSGGGSGFPIVPKYAEDIHTGYVSNGSWYFDYSDSLYSDVWKVKSSRKYIAVLGSTVGNRFRGVWTTHDTSQSSGSGSSTSFGSDVNNPPAYAVKSENNVRAFSAPSDGYITITKSNTGQSNIPCYLIDVTDAPI